jgi:hypothetical protein
VFTIIIFVIAVSLVLYYTKRMTGARNDSVHVYDYLTRNNVDCAGIAGKDVTTKRTWCHDFGELLLFALILLLSCAPAVIAWTVVPLRVGS